MTQGVLHVGVDDGYADTKIASARGCFVFPSRGKRLAAGEAPEVPLVKSAHPGLYLIDGERIQVDAAIGGDDTCNGDFHTSALDVALVHHVLGISGLAGQPVHVAVGLPFGAYFDADGRVNRELVEAKRQSLLRAVSREDGGPLAKIVDVSVFSQSLSAWINYVVDAKGVIRADLPSVGVVDIGGRTTDIVVVQPPNRVDMRHSATFPIGIMDVYRLVEQALGVRQMPSQLLQLAVTKGIYLEDGRTRDISAIVANAKAAVMGRIEWCIRDTLGDDVSLDSLLFVGGGYCALADIAQRFPRAVAVDSPAYANARGQWKALHFLGEKRN